MIRDSLVLVALCVCVIAVLSGPGIRSMDVDVDASHDYDYDSDSDYSHDYDVAYEHDEALDLDGGGFVPHQQAVKQQQQQQQQQQPQQVQQQHTFKVQLPTHQHQQALPIQPQPVKLLLPIQQQQPTQTYHLPIQQQQQQSLPIQHQTQTITATAAAALPIQTHAKLQSSPVRAAAATPALRVKQSLPIHLQQQQLMPVQQQRLPIQQPHAKLMQQPSMPIQQAATAAAAAVQQKKVMPQLQQPVKMIMSSGSSSKKKVGAIATTLATTDFCALPLTQASSYNAATGMFHIELTPLSNIVPAAVDLHISKNCGGSTAAGMNVMHAKTTAVQQQQQSLPLQQKQQQQAIHTLGVAVGSVKSAAAASSSSLRVAQQQASSKIGVKPSQTAEMCAQAFDQYYFDQPYSINLHAEATAAVTSAVMKQQLPIQQQAQLPIQQQSAAAAAVKQPTATIHFAAAGTGSTVARASSEGAQFAGNKFMFNVNLNDKPIMQTLNVGDHLCYAFTYLYEGGVGCNTNICSLPAPASCANVRYTASARFDASASKIHASFQPQTALIPTAVDLHITKNCVDAHSPLLTAMMNANTCSASGPASTSSIPYSRLQAPFGTPLALNVHANRVQPSQSSAGATFSPTTNEYHFQVSLPSDHPLRASLAQGDVLCYAFTYLLSDVGCDTGVCATNIAVPVAAVKQQPLQLPIQQAIKQQLPIQQAATVKQALPIQQQPIVAAIEQSMPIQQQAQAAAAAAVKQQQQPVQQQQQATAAVKQSLSIQQVQQAVQQAVHHQQQQTAAATAAAAKQSLPVQHQQQPVQQAAAVKQSLPIQQAAKQTVSLPVQQQASVGGAGAN